LNIGGKG
jgi:hypothetical protein